MDSKEKAYKVRMLEQILKESFGITSRKELLEAVEAGEPLDISIFVTPLEKDSQQ